MQQINLDIWLYGPLDRYGSDADNNVFANLKLELPDGTRMRDLLDHLGLPTEERGITFISGQLSATPGLQPDLDLVLQDGDRVALFHLKSMWPFQYRHGAARTPELTEAMDGEGLYHYRADQS